MKIYLLLFVLFFVGLVASAPSDYLELVSNTNNCGDFSQPICETIYKIKNPNMASSSNVDQTNFKLFFQELGGKLGEETTNLNDIKLDYFNGAKWTTLDKKNFNLPMLPESNYLLRITAKKTWKPTGYLNEEKIENVDNIIGLFGYNYTEYAWWNSSYTYRRSVTITADAASSGSVWILSQNLTQIMLDGKLDAQGTCARITGSDETTLLFMENKYANLTNMNATYLVLNDTITAGTNTRYLYYSNLTNCPYDATFRMSAYNYSGLMKAMWYLNNTANQSQQPDFPDFQNNYTNYGVATPQNSGGVGYSVRYANSGSYSPVGTRFNNLLQGTVVVKFNSDNTAASIINRGSLGSNDFQVYHQGGASPKPLFFQMASGPGFSSTGNLALSTYYIAGISWNATGYQMYIDGIFNTSSANTSLILPNAPTKFLTFGFLEGYALANLTGNIPFALFFNRTLSGSEQKLLASYGNEPLGSETTQNTSGNIVFNSYDQITGLGIITNITISNSTYSVQLNNSQTYTVDSINLPQGLVTIVFSNSSYYSSSIITTITNSSQTINGYLISTSYSNAIFVRFHVSSNDYVAIQNANIYIYRGNNLVFTSLTDATGASSTYLDSMFQYQIIVNKTGYPSLTSYITPVQNDYYIFLTVTQYINFTFSYSNMSTYLTPDPRILYLNRSTINFTGISIERMYNYIGILGTYNGSTIFNYSNYSVYTATFLVNVNILNLTGYIWVTPYFKLNGLSEQRMPQVFTISNTSGLMNSSGLGLFYSDINDSSLSNFGIGIALLFIGLLLSAFIAWQFGIGSGIVALLILFLVMGSGVFTLNTGLQPFDAYGGMNAQYWMVYVWIVVFIFAIIALKVFGV